MNICCISYSLLGQQRKCKCLQRAMQTVTATVTENITLKGFNVTSLRRPSGAQNRLVHVHSRNIRKTSETAWHEQQQRSCAPPRCTGPLTYATCSFLSTKILLTALKLLTNKTKTNIYGPQISSKKRVFLHTWKNEKAFTYYMQDRKHFCYFCHLSSKNATLKLLRNTHALNC